MHLRYTAVDKSWDLDLKLEGFTDEQIAYLRIVLQKEMGMLSILYPDLMRVPKRMEEKV